MKKGELMLPMFIERTSGALQVSHGRSVAEHCGIEV